MGKMVGDGTLGRWVWGLPSRKIFFALSKYIYSSEFTSRQKLFLYAIILVAIGEKV